MSETEHEPEGQPEEPQAEPAPLPEHEEAEGHEEHEEAEGEQEEEPALSPPPADSLREAKNAAKRIETAKGNYAKKLGEILGEEAQTLALCPRCNGDELPFGGIPGFLIPGVPPIIPEELKNAVLASIGETPEQVTERDSFSRQCDTCKGWGRVLSGSRVTRERTLACVPCGGKGWIAVGPERQGGQVAPAAPVGVNGETGEIEEAPQTDPWGRTADHPDYGRLPQYAAAS